MNAHVFSDSFSQISLSLLIIGLLLEVDEVDEEEGAEQRGLDPDVEVDGEADAEVVGVGEGLPEDAAPLLGDLADLLGAVGREHVEGDVSAAGAGEEAGALDLQHHVVGGVVDVEEGLAAGAGTKKMSSWR